MAYLWGSKELFGLPEPTGASLALGIPNIPSKSKLRIRRERLTGFGGAAVVAAGGTGFGRRALLSGQGQLASTYSAEPETQPAIPAVAAQPDAGASSEALGSGFGARLARQFALRGGTTQR